MKLLKNNMVIIIIGVILITVVGVIASSVISSESISYSNGKTDKTTVKDVLDELISKLPEDYTCSGDSCKKCVRATTLHTEECL